jgi:hypothetical protein
MRGGSRNGAQKRIMAPASMLDMPMQLTRISNFQPWWKALLTLLRASERWMKARLIYFEKICGALSEAERQIRLQLPAHVKIKLQHYSSNN